MKPAPPVSSTRCGKFGIYSSIFGAATLATRRLLRAIEELKRAGDSHFLLLDSLDPVPENP
jgi:hypothetical protein